MSGLLICSQTRRTSHDDTMGETRKGNTFVSGHCPCLGLDLLEALLTTINNLFSRGIPLDFCLSLDK